MRILIDGLSSHLGGIGSLILNLAIAATEVSEYKDTIFVFLIYEDSEYINTLEERHFCYLCTPRFGSEPIKYAQFLKAHFKSNIYDCLWINNTSKVNYLLPYYGKKYARAKIIFHSHGCDTEETGLKKIIFQFFDHMNYERFQKIADVRLACSAASADYFYGVHNKYRDMVRIIKNGIFISKFEYNLFYRKKIRTELKLEEDNIALILVGRLSMVKNQKFAITLMTQLDNSYKLFLFGDGELRKELEEFTICNKVEDRVSFMGSCRNINEYLSAMDIFLMPSLHEGFPFSVIEAQTSGLSCIVSAHLSKELNIDGRVQYADIGQESEWISAIKNAERKERSIGAEIIRRKGYSIEDSVRTFFELVRGDSCNDTEE